MLTSKNIGFWSVLSIVVSSQVGSGIFLLPSTLAPFGYISILSWLLTGLGAIFLALTFSNLCKQFPKTGGPHAFVYQAFGKKAAFFTAWTYWVISWISSVALILTAVSYINYIIDCHNIYLTMILKITITIASMLLNLNGLHISRQLDFVFTLLKLLPLVILPLICLPSINYDYFITSNNYTVPLFLQNLQAASFITFWGFIGFETATAPAEAVINPTKTIPKAIIIGTSCVIAIYLLSSIAILGTVPNNILATSIAPFAEAANITLGNNWNNIIAFSAIIICLSTLNAWILTSGQIALGAAQDQLFPQFFLKKNQQNDPIWGVIISSLGMIVLILCTASSHLIEQINFVINISVIAFLWIYAICTISYLKILFTSELKTNYNNFIISVIALIFCIWIMLGSGWNMLLSSLSITATGIPIYIYTTSVQNKK
ncbi:amino acid permease family protein [Orientia chuto str. Dubai]|uniref:Arginine/agmatine antiporter n=1 Tax=Orientia chuto str. Dubai TaxID=1359168 RepID=A0A0F3ML40_9RICK|nr:amino acid permease [Candidatus Orientia mediorientalis]KJV56366.1 amino acid permease family protein [Orientia chuto str. Dubai]